MTCRNICVKYKVKKPYKTRRYDQGQKRCSTCDIFLEWKGFRCPCCTNVLRTNARRLKNKKRFS